jgi:hypothetical protein
VAELDAGWPHGSQDVIGQAGEFFVWANLITQSGGGLHVFLPMLDRGIDAVVHRLGDDTESVAETRARHIRDLRSSLRAPIQGSDRLLGLS